MAALPANQIQDLLQPPDVQGASDRARALVDKQFGSLDVALDIAALERAAALALSQHEDLSTKADASQTATTQLVAETLNNTRSQVSAAQELSLARYALIDDLTTLNDELVSSMSDANRSPTLLEELETLQRRLRELESVRDYIAVVHHALGLCEGSVREMQASAQPVSKSHPAIEQYKQLQAFVSNVKNTSASVENEPLALVEFLESVQRRAWAGIIKVLTTDLITASERLGWPMPVQYGKVDQQHRVAFEKSFRRLLLIQEIGQAIHESDGTAGRATPLYALQALVQPVSLRFKFHFDGDRITNRPDKPELFFTHILDVSHQHKSFLQDYAQRLLDKSPYAEIDAWREFTRLLFPILTRKIRATVPLLLQHPALLAHLIYQTIAFDAAVRDAGFDLKGTMSKQEEWEGLCDVILNHAEWFEAWLEGERQFDYDQYYEIEASPNAWSIADDQEDEDGARADVRSTNSARRVKALVEQITDRYQPLPRLAHRVRFLLHVQLPLLDEYRNRIKRSLDAFEQLSSSLAAVVPGGLSGQVDMGSRRMTSGVEGLSRLVKALLSAKTLEKAMRAWGEDVFFLDLWAEIGRRPALRAFAESHPMLPVRTDTEDETVFSQMILAYSNQGTRGEDMIVRQVVRDIQEDVQPYLAQSWEHGENSEGATLPAGLAAPMSSLASQLVFLRSTLPATHAVALYRRIASALAQFIIQRGIIYRGRFKVSPEAAVRFTQEARAWVETCRASFPREPVRRLEVPWGALVSACSLLTMEGDGFARVSRAVESDLTYGAVVDEFGLHDIARLDAREIVRARVDFKR